MCRRKECLLIPDFFLVADCRKSFLQGQRFSGGVLGPSSCVNFTARSYLSDSSLFACDLACVHESLSLGWPTWSISGLGSRCSYNGFLEACRVLASWHLNWRFLEGLAVDP